MKKLLQYLESDAEREGLLKTPQRVINSFDEIFSGYEQDPAEVLDSTFNEKGMMALFYYAILNSIQLVNTTYNHSVDGHT